MELIFYADDSIDVTVKKYETDHQAKKEREKR